MSFPISTVFRFVSPQQKYESHRRDRHYALSDKKCIIVILVVY